MFKTLHSGKFKDTYIEPEFFGHRGLSRPLINHFTSLQVYEDPDTHTTLYSPVQANQHCWTTSNQGLQCKIKTAKFNYDAANGYGGKEASVK